MEQAGANLFLEVLRGRMFGSKVDATMAALPAICYESYRHALALCELVQLSQKLAAFSLNDYRTLVYDRSSALFEASGALPGCRWRTIGRGESVLR